jgi:3'-phosphoadenosine 5'-phosphosulfate sulfotransferase (PAPS reductase)/FAD synthetase
VTGCTVPRHDTQAEPIITIGTLSGGIGSWAACRLWINQHGAERFACLFADTLLEDEDTYRFLGDAARELDVPLHRVTASKDIWAVFRDHRWIGNSQLAHCSWDLKTEPSRQWIHQAAPHADTIIVGIDATETHRLPDITKRWAADGLTARAPLAEAGWWKRKAQALAEQHGLQPPRMYAMGFAHANCKGCVKAGHAHWLRVLQHFPDIYAHHEQQEAKLRAELGQGAILRDWRNDAAPMTLTELRERATQHDPELDLFDEGGCGCLT